MARLKIKDSKSSKNDLKVGLAKAKEAIKDSTKNTKMANLPPLPPDLEYYRQGDGGIGIRERKETFKPVPNYPYPRA
tara:strand:- start:56 stop:286 length:231 start_codon:yes stop_codon:yes gene_type:complete